MKTSAGMAIGTVAGMQTVLMLLLATTGQAQLTNVSLEFNTMPQQLHLFFTDYHLEADFLLTSPRNFYHVGNGYSGTGGPSNGTPFLQFYTNTAPITISHVTGQPFNLLGVDLAEYSTSLVATAGITFWGRRTNGETVQQTFYLDGIIDGSGPLNDFESFSFGPQFTNLVSVTTSNHTFALDNLRLTTAPFVGNRPPFVTAHPAFHVAYTPNAMFYLQATAIDPDGQIAKVEFFANSNLLGEATVSTSYTDVYNFNWTNQVVGDYLIYAVATDDQGATWVSQSTWVYSRPRQYVSVSVKDGEAVETAASQSPNPGIFTIQRTGELTQPLLVSFSLSGSATNGVAYQQIPTQAEIPAGLASVDVVIQPIDDTVMHPARRVNLSLLPAPPSGPDGLVTAYLLSAPSTGGVYLLDNDYAANSPPTVQLFAPTQNALISSSNVVMTVYANDVEGYVANVALFGDNQLLSFITNTPSSAIPTQFTNTWNNVAPGLHFLTVQAWDNRSAVRTAGPVPIVVQPGISNVPVVYVNGMDTNAIEEPVCINNVWYTNAAFFILTRSGNTNSAVTVNCIVSGTASNGVDYIRLPSAITLPAGMRSTNIVVFPLDDTEIETAETVELTLAASAAQPPAYLVGYPATASVTLSDHDMPGQPTFLTNGYYCFGRSVTNGLRYIIAVSPDLRNWTAVLTNTTTEVGLQYIDVEAPLYKSRFYRIFILGPL